MNNVANKLICLNLNSNWQPVGFKTVKDAIVDLCGSESYGKPSTLALNIEYELDDNGQPIFDEAKSMNPVSWDEWMMLPIRPWDLFINSPTRSIRVPTVIIATNFNKMPIKTFKGKPSKDGIWNRDQGICQYTGKKLTKDQWAKRFIAPAGITGLWQVKKRRKGNMSEDERMELDIAYAEKSSFIFDLIILFLTIPALINKDSS